MGSVEMWARQAALCATILAFSGCSDDYQPYPPPQEYPSVGVGVGAGGGGAGGTGGAPTWSGNLCECAYDFIFNTSCGSCFNKALNDDTACKPAYLTCAMDAACVELLNCPGKICYKPGVTPGPDEIACVQGCYLPWTQDMAHSLFSDLMSCACGACAKECAPTKTIACDTGSMSSGSGGGSSSSSGP